MKKEFIGVFDSGVGGISVLADLLDLLPSRDFVYLADSKNAPYGTKSKKAVLELSYKICKDFAQEGAAAVVIACNTATSAAAKELRDDLGTDIPIIGMEPAVKPASQSCTGKIAVIATPMTLREEKYLALLSRLGIEERVVPVPAPELVILVENHLDNKGLLKDSLESFVRSRLNPIEDLEAIVLGCTHFVFLKEYFQNLLDEDIKIFDGNKGTAVHLAKRLEEEIAAEYSSLAELNSPGSVMLRSSGGEEYGKNMERLLRHRLSKDDYRYVQQIVNDISTKSDEEDEISSLAHMYYQEKKSINTIRKQMQWTKKTAEEKVEKLKKYAFDLAKKNMEVED